MMGGRRLRASGWASSTPRVVGQRRPGEAGYDARPANTSICKRLPGAVCGAYLTPGTRYRRQVLRAERFYRHAPGKLGASS